MRKILLVVAAVVLLLLVVNVLPLQTSYTTHFEHHPVTTTVLPR